MWRWVGGGGWLTVMGWVRGWGGYMRADTLRGAMRWWGGGRLGGWDVCMEFGPGLFFFVVQVGRAA